jgi:hypothetical protein
MAPASASQANTGAAEPSVGLTTGGAAETSGGMAMEEMNKNTARVGHWYVKVLFPEEQEYSYQCRQTKAMRKSSKFHCILMSSVETSYGMGTIKMMKGNKSEMKDLVKKFKADSIWKLENVVFLDEKSNYVSTPFKKVIDLRGTKTTEVLQSLVKMPPMLWPPSTITDILDLQHTQRFDIAGIVVGISTTRHTITSLGKRAIVDVQLVDGTKQADGKTAQMDFAIFFAEAQEANTDPPALVEFRSLVNSELPKAIAFLALTGAIGCTGDKHKVEISTSNDFKWIPAHGTQADNLAQEATALQSLPMAEKSIISKTWEPTTAKDYLVDPATLTTAALLDTFAVGDNAIGTDWVFQINYAIIQTPSPETTLKTQKGDRIFSGLCSLISLVPSNWLCRRRLLCNCLAQNQQTNL